GVRVGSAAITTRGFGVDDCVLVADLISRVLHAPDDEGVKSQVQAEVLDLTSGFGVPGIDRSAL
ncbi:MAG TPA: serine hydroxymethyltransferase, partial [Thermomicrobiales bacterium]|nr:serine hydroxymethyltransferase [Thermomicrobiales bacterium]